MVTAGAPAAATAQTDVQDTTGAPATVVSRAPNPAPRDHRAEFNALDRNSDGSVTRSEAAADKYMVRTFRALDTDRNGSLDYDEALQWLDD